MFYNLLTLFLLGSVARKKWLEMQQGSKEEMDALRVAAGTNRFDDPRHVDASEKNLNVRSATKVDIVAPTESATQHTEPIDHAALSERGLR